MHFLTQIVCRLGLCPRPHWGSLQRPQTSVVNKVLAKDLTLKAKDLTFKAKDLTSEQVEGLL